MIHNRCTKSDERNSPRPVNEIDLGSRPLTKDSFIDAEFRGSYSDLVYDGEQDPKDNSGSGGANFKAQDPKHSESRVCIDRMIR